MNVHVSFDHVQKFIPKVPKQRIKGEDSVTPRICVAGDVVSALRAIPEAGYAIRGMQLLHMPVVIHAYYLTGDVFIPTLTQLPDQEWTGEKWMLEKPRNVYHACYLLESPLLLEHTDLFGVTQPYLVGCKLKRVKNRDNREILFKRFTNKTEILANYSFRTIASTLGRYGAM